jgi:hypothetical protein
MEEINERSFDTNPLKCIFRPHNIVPHPKDNRPTVDVSITVQFIHLRVFSAVYILVH